MRACSLPCAIRSRRRDVDVCCTLARLQILAEIGEIRAEVDADLMAAQVRKIRSQMRICGYKVQRLRFSGPPDARKIKGSCRVGRGAVQCEELCSTRAAKHRERCMCSWCSAFV